VSTVDGRLERKGREALPLRARATLVSSETAVLV
jgi:hypothetical protein